MRDNKKPEWDYAVATYDLKNCYKPVEWASFLQPGIVIKKGVPLDNFAWSEVRKILIKGKINQLRNFQ